MKLTPDWICGFVEGKGSFVISITKIKSSQSEQVRLLFQVTQDVKNVQLLYALKNYFQVGIVKAQKKDPSQSWEFVVHRFEHVWTKIIPFFEKYAMHSTKKFDFYRFRKVAIMINRKDHFTPEGVAKMKSIALRMNQLETFSEIDFLETEESMTQFRQDFVEDSDVK